MRTLKIASVIGAVVLAGTLGLTGCSSGGNSDGSSTASAADDAKGKGFEEYPVGEDKEAEKQINVSVVYFKPVDMEPQGMGLKAADASFHLEADVTGLEGNTLGYGKGDFVPGLTVDYSFTDKDTGEEVTSGTFMQMNASDGPHYGANIALPKDATYQLTLKIHSPAENGWMLHVDEDTGVEGRFWTTPIELSWDWQYTAHQW
ncbi:iron transporter [Actinomyces sp. ZJ308]|uniref:iron transporter n=1 Tax=Actinomyces sp. ZJ308 TaxID=2708342 RepID=UPI001423A709|nr:iron transporter [Actinomyces sp. ZJ308]